MTAKIKHRQIMICLSAADEIALSNRMREKFPNVMFWEEAENTNEFNFLDLFSDELENRESKRGQFNELDYFGGDYIKTYISERPDDWVPVIEKADYLGTEVWKLKNRPKSIIQYVKYSRRTIHLDKETGKHVEVPTESSVSYTEFKNHFDMQGGYDPDDPEQKRFVNGIFNLSKKFCTNRTLVVDILSGEEIEERSPDVVWYGPDTIKRGSEDPMYFLFTFRRRRRFVGTKALPKKTKKR